MKRQRLDLRSGMLVERGRDWNGYFYIACAKGASVFIRDEKELRRFLKLPKGTPSRELLDAFLAEAQPRANDEGEEKREELLALLDERLGNDPATEDAVVRGQLAEIALLRLAELIGAEEEAA